MLVRRHLVDSQSMRRLAPGSVRAIALARTQQETVLHRSPSAAKEAGRTSVVR